MLVFGTDTNGVRAVGEREFVALIQGMSESELRIVFNLLVEDDRNSPRPYLSSLSVDHQAKNGKPE